MSWRVPGSGSDPVMGSNKRAALRLIADPHDVSVSIAVELHQVERIVARLLHDRRLGRPLSLEQVASLVGHCTTLLILAPGEER